LQGFKRPQTSSSAILLKNTFLVLIGVTAIVVGGYFAIKNTPVDAIPDVGEKQVIVFADRPGARRRTWTIRSLIR